MKYRRHQSSDDSRPVDINLSPLIDCVFLLLIFFVSTSREGANGDISET